MMNTDDREPPAVTRGGRLERIAVVVVCSAAFGAAASAVHGANGGTRAAIGNLSLPWLLLPFIAGAWGGRGSPLRGCVIGAIATVVGLLAFYSMNVLVLNVDPGQPLAHRFAVTIRSGTVFIKFGALSGPAFGALGASWHRSRRASILVLLAALAMLEPLAQEMYFESGGTSQFSANAAAWIPEFMLGAAALAWIVGHARRRSSHRPQLRL